MSWLSSKFEISRHGESSNVRPMEGLRGFAVFLVFLAHYVSLIDPWIEKNALLEQSAELIHAIGNVGVDLFFVLSGYLIYASMITRPQGFMRFMRRRVARIYPAFCVVFALYLAISFVHPADSKIRGDGWDAVLYVLQNFLLLPGLFPIEPIITVAWSLSYEMFYYLAIPLTIAVFQLRLRSVRWRVRFFLLMAAAIAVHCALYGGHVRLIMFISGILLHEALRDGSLRAPGSAAALCALIVGLAATALPFAGPAAFTVRILFLFCTFFIVCYTCFRRSDGWLALGFSLTPLRWLGNMSYSYYLLHGLTLKLAFTVLAWKLPQASHETLFFIGMMPPMFIVTVIPAAGLFLLVERPLSLGPAPQRIDAPAGVAAAKAH